MSDWSTPKKVHENKITSVCILVHAIRLMNVQSEKHTAIRRSRILSNCFLEFRNTKNPTKSAMIVAGICE